MKKRAEEFRTTEEVKENCLKRIAEEAPKHEGRRVLLCFGCDPYQPIALTSRVTREAIRILGEAGCYPIILTKSAVLQDFDLLKLYRGEYGATLTFVDARDSKEWEPGAPLPHQRIEALRKANWYGIRTWVSLEPVIDPEQTLELIDMTHSFVNVYKVGKLNHMKNGSDINWPAFRDKVEEKLDHYRCRYYIKKDLQEAK